MKRISVCRDRKARTIASGMRSLRHLYIELEYNNNAVRIGILNGKKDLQTRAFSKLDHTRLMC